MILKTHGRPVTHLEGRYWTDRRTAGEAKFAFKCKEGLSEVPKELGEHPMRELNAGSSQ